MISFEGFRAIEGVPIYLQIVNHIKRGCVAKTIVNGDSLPSRRYLSALLRINPMTVQKAFRLLEEEGLISSVQGSGSFITIDNEKIIRIKAELLNDEIRKMMASLKQMGISKDEAVELIVRQWEENSDE